MNRIAHGVCGAVIVIVLAATSLTAPARAASLVDQGSTTFDPNTGLVWLDVDLTASLSYNTVVDTLLGAGQTYSGYRYATVDEVNSLFVNAGITQFTNHGADNSIADLVALLGATYLPGPDSSGLGGMTADEYPQDLAYIYYVDLISGTDDLNNSVAGIGGILRKDAVLPADSWGSFLVRKAPALLIEPETDLIPNPLPGALPLFAGGLGVIVYLARRKKRAAQT